VVYENDQDLMIRFYKFVAKYVVSLSLVQISD